MASPQDMLDAIDAALAANPIGVATVRWADGRTVQYESRTALLQERAYWQRLVDAQASEGGGIQMCRLSLTGDA